MANPVLFENGYIAFTTSTGGAAYTELSGVKEIRMAIGMADLDDAAMGDTVEAKYPGLLQVPIDVSCRQDFTTAAAGVDKLIATRQLARTAFKVKVRPVDGAVADDNPTYMWSKVRIHGSTPIDGPHGAALVNKIKLVPQSGCTFARSTTT
jgi:hypothetical protein